VIVFRARSAGATTVSLALTKSDTSTTALDRAATEFECDEFFAR
jgi:hypothetical protein